jgi:hypothetical protein
MIRRRAVVRTLIILAAALSLGSVAPVSASAQTSPWWPGDPEVILGYGCTSIDLEPRDGRFNCPAGASRVHEAVDIALAYGTPIFAGWPGTVMEVGGPEAHDYGPHYVKIWLDEGHDINLGHLSAATVVPGQRVDVGTLVGYVGELGVTDIPNLDFGARPHGGGPYQSVDPAPFLAFVDPSRTSQSNAAVASRAGVQMLVRSTANKDIWSTDLKGGWEPILGGPSHGFASQAVIGGNGSGLLIAVAIGQDGALWTASQTESLSANTSWRDWQSLGRPRDTILLGTPTLGFDSLGSVYVFARAADSTLWELRQNRAGGSWPDWDASPFERLIASDPMVARDATGALEVLAASGDGRLLVNRQPQAAGPWTGWTSLGAPAGHDVGFQGAPAVVRDAEGLLEAFAVSRDGSVFVATQTDAGGGAWTQWNQIGSGSGGAVGAITRPDGRVQVFELTASGFLITATRHGATTGPWRRLGGGLSGSIAVALAVDASPLVFVQSVQEVKVVRSDEVQQFDRHRPGVMESEIAVAKADAWTTLPRLPHGPRALPSRIAA